MKDSRKTGIGMRLPALVYHSVGLYVLERLLVILTKYQSENIVLTGKFRNFFLFCAK